MYGRLAEEMLRLEHRHDDGSWGTLERTHHDPADHDPERGWAKGDIIYACTTCDEVVRVRPSDPGVEPA